MDDLLAENKLSAGKFSSIGNTLNTWKMHNEALAIFNKKLEIYPDKSTTWNQLGITNLLLGNTEEAIRCFSTLKDKNPMDSRAYQYYQLFN